MTTPATNKQIPDNSILDFFNKQTYLGNQYMVSINNTPGVTTELPLLLIRNVGTSNAQTAISTFNNLRRITCLTASQTAIMRIYLNPTITGNGTTQTPVNLRPKNTQVPVSLVGLLPTVSVNGTLIGTYSIGALGSAPDDLLAILDQGSSMLYTVQAGSAGTIIAMDVGFYEL